MKKRTPCPFALDEILDAIQWRAMLSGKDETYQEKRVDTYVKIEGGKGLARVAVVPDKNLDRHHQRGVEQQRAAQEEDGCNRA